MHGFHRLRVVMKCAVLWGLLASRFACADASSCAINPVPASAELAVAQKCFAFYTGHTVPGVSLESCQTLGGRFIHCNPEKADSFATFFNIKHQEDTLAIPVDFYSDICDLYQQCGSPTQPGGAFRTFIADLAAVGFARLKTDQYVPDKQRTEKVNFCIHLPASISVKWLHMHVFHGESVAGEIGLADDGTSAVCSAHNLWKIDDDDVDFAAVAHSIVRKFLNVHPFACKATESTSTMARSLPLGAIVLVLALALGALVLVLALARTMAPGTSSLPPKASGASTEIELSE